MNTIKAWATVNNSIYSDTRKPRLQANYALDKLYVHATAFSNSLSYLHIEAKKGNEVAKILHEAMKVELRRLILLNKDNTGGEE